MKEGPRESKAPLFLYYRAEGLHPSLELCSPVGADRIVLSIFQAQRAGVILASGTARRT